MVSKFFVAELAIINDLLLRQRLSFILIVNNGTKIFFIIKIEYLNRSICLVTTFVQIFLSDQIILMSLMSFAVISKMDEVGSVLDTMAR